MKSPMRDASVISQIGRSTTAPRSVEMANWLPVEPMRSVRPAVSMSFLFSLERKAAKRLATQAARSASTEKSRSAIDARPTPPMTGMRQSHLAEETDWPYSVTPRSAAKAGSAAFTIWAKETAPRFIEKIDDRCAPAAHAATGMIFFTSSIETAGKARASGAAQRKRAYTEPMRNWRKPTVTGKPVAPPAALSAYLLFSV
mmetsp:Transcript_3859/g.10080  ORF Transcript_3859/g.10080 Transcript_3859/m.10080 type:complete len:200 (+) Transcript_3859:648-1247(+)